MALRTTTRCRRWAEGRHDQDYREPWPAFRNRVERALQRGQTALVFTSGGAISVICRQLPGLSSRRALRLNWTLTDASISKLLVGRGGLHLSNFNEHVHLEQVGPGSTSGLISYR